MPLNLSPFSLVKSISQGLNNVEEPVARVNSFLQAMKSIHEVHERQWFLNIANYVGNQYILWDRITRRFSIPPAPTWRVRLVINKILPIARIQIAKLREMALSFYVSPSTSDEEDQAAAKIGTKYTEYLHRSGDFSEVDDDIAHWLIVTGNAYVFPLYDENAGVEIQDAVLNPNGEPMIDLETGQPTVRKFKTGDIRFDFATPFEVVPDYSTTKWSEQFAVVKRKIRSTEYVKEKYGVDVSPESLTLNYNSAIRVMEQATSSGHLVDINQTLKHAVMVNDYYEAASERFPKGRHIITANNKLLFDGVLTTKYRGKYVIPAVHYGAIKVPGRLMRMSPLEPLLPLQWQYNRGRSQVVEDTNLMGRPKLLTPIDSLVNGVYTDQPGEMLEWDPAVGPPPHYLQAPGPSSSLLQHLSALEQEMQDIGGVHEISMGRLPRRATSGFALSILDEKDGTVMGPLKDSIKRGHERVFSMALSIAAERFDETRQIKIVGRNNAQDLIAFRGADLNSQDDVRVVGDDPFPTSRSAKLEFAINLAKNGLVSAQTVRKMLGITDFANFDDVLLDEEQQRIQAQNLPPAGVGGPPQGAPPPAPPGAPPELSPEELAALADQLPTEGT